MVSRRGGLPVEAGVPEFWRAAAAMRSGIAMNGTPQKRRGADRDERWKVGGRAGFGPVAVVGMQATGAWSAVKGHEGVRFIAFAIFGSVRRSEAHTPELQSLMRISHAVSR